jgi:hypothetical protein
LTIEQKENGMSRKTLLRLLIVLTIITAIPSFWFTPLSPLAVRAEVTARFGEAVQASGLSGPVIISTMALFLAFIASVIGFIGLWWCKRWARLVFTIGNIFGLSSGVAMSIFTALVPLAVSPTGQAGDSRGILATVSDTNSMLLGAILALTWFGMPREFE